MDSQSSSLSSAAVQPRVLSHKRRRNGSFTAASSTVKLEDECDVSLDSCCNTSGESSSDESDSSFEVEEEEEEEEEEALAAVKRRRRADLDGIKKSVRCMEAQVVDASAQLKDLAALVAQVVARRQQQQLRA